jgi:hypothetical protein
MQSLDVGKASVALAIVNEKVWHKPLLAAPRRIICIKRSPMCSIPRGINVHSKQIEHLQLNCQPRSPQDASNLVLNGVVEGTVVVTAHLETRKRKPMRIQCDTAIPSGRNTKTNKPMGSTGRAR